MPIHKHIRFLALNGWLKVSRLTRVSLPIKVVTRVAVALAIDAGLETSRAVCKGNMVVSDVVEEMDFVLVEEETGGNGVNRSIAPTFIEETAIPIKRLEKVDIGLAAKPFEAADLKVRPLIELPLASRSW